MNINLRDYEVDTILKALKQMAEYYESRYIEAKEETYDEEMYKEAFENKALAWRLYNRLEKERSNYNERI